MTPPAESKDDERIVKWHWEEVKGPLREEKVSADTDILTLTNLVPGNYTFRYISVATLLHQYTLCVYLNNSCIIIPHYGFPVHLFISLCC